MHQKNYENLANAIIIQAANDYRASWKKKNGAAERRQIEKFFNSTMFANITEVEPSCLIRKLKEEHQ